MANHSVILSYGGVQLRRRRRRQPDITINRVILDWAIEKYGHIPIISDDLFRMFHLEHNYV